MSFDGFPDEALVFYEGLQADNSKTYWQQHKDAYDRAVKAPMQALLDALGPEFGESKLFRPYRDVRFSADKSPYKTHQGAFCELHSGVGFYVQLDADGLLTAGGFHAHSREQTARYRASVNDDATGGRLEAILEKLAKGGFTPGGDMVRTRPRGVPADHPRLELMRHESLTVAKRYTPDETLQSPKLLAMVRKDWTAMRPLMEWIDQHVGAFEA